MAFVSDHQIPAVLDHQRRGPLPLALVRATGTATFPFRHVIPLRLGSPALDVSPEPQSLTVAAECQILRPYPFGVTPPDVQALLLLESQPATHPLTDEHLDGIAVASEQPVGDLYDDTRLLPGLPVGSMSAALAAVNQATGQRPLAFSLP